MLSPEKTEQMKHELGEQALRVRARGLSVSLGSFL